MFLISLMLAATTPPAVKPEVVPRREARRPAAASAAARSKRLIELEAAVRSLSATASERRGGDGPQGL
jgi:hypothetical protein